MKIELLSESVENTENIGKSFADQLKKGDFVALVGDLGAGKTAFVRGMASLLTPNAQVCSPTYAIVNEYNGDKIRLCHFDIYRLADADDLESVGFYDYKDCVMAVEWCDKIKEALPDEYYLVTILGSGDETRRISIEKISDQ
ncbi:MAG: tRNA (adenosine(37)-N6)-threonylcarbamoyltransferase complex ATPase subunit type 1 TsaE [Clostridia bacterium]|nr:tRNA (adenosine(37)-N6)-threonylcarbamoyltransferase complex ATPase subunit type 1 TsaE [Clostridia bacterium]